MGRLILALGLASLGALAAAQETPLSKKITVKYHLPLAAVLKDLGERAGVRFAFSEKLLDGYGPVTYQAQDQEAGRVATDIVRPRRLRLEQAQGGVVKLVKLDPLDEFKVKREGPFEFAEKPKVTREGDRATITFQTKAFCDVTVAIENTEGTIIRHLASGVLGENAPEPFQWNSKKQTIVWDGKNDQGVYIDDKDSHTVRVSLGLKPEYERAFLWSPYRRAGSTTPTICSAPEGMYVFDGNFCDHLRLFDHEGRYVRTVYPFPADKVDAVKGVKRQFMPQSGKDIPFKGGFYESTLLTSGYTGVTSSAAVAGLGGTLAMAIHQNRLFLPCLRLNRIATDGSSGGMELEGSGIAIPVQWNFHQTVYRLDLAPRSAAVSPDGKTLYLASFSWDRNQDAGGFEWIHGVAQMDALGNDPPRPFVGPPLKRGTEIAGTDNTHFRQPFSVACDAQGHVYVADYGNDRVQVFNPDGTHVKTIPVSRPTDVCIHPKTGDIYVFSWLCAGPWTPEKQTPASAGLDMSKLHVPAVMRHLGPLSNPREISCCSLPLPRYTDISTHYYNRFGGIAYRAALDAWTEPPTIWLVPGMPDVDTLYTGRLPWTDVGIVVLTEKNGKLELKRNFSTEAAVAVPHLEPPIAHRQRLFVNPKTGKLYVAEGDESIEGKSFHELIEIDPGTGRRQLVQVPFNAEDMAFGPDGLAYLRSLSDIVRYDPATWREVPFDYGEVRDGVGFTGGHGRQARALSAIAFNAWVWHQGGMNVSPKGDIAVAFYYQRVMEERRFGPPTLAAGKPCTPRLYPGRGGRAIVHVWDKHGKVVLDDAIPGLGILDGVAIDNSGDLYASTACTRVLDGKRYFDYMTGTAVKFRLGQAKIITTDTKDVPVPLAAGAGPNRPQELDTGAVGPAWAEGAQWFYGGVGFCGKNSPIGHACACSNSRFCLDYFARSFVPEIQHYTVGVLDTNGNLILRVGRYGNTDDGKPLIAAGGPPNTKSIGGDEVGLFYPAYLGTHTDRRLFIADPGNSRIVSVKLGYHAEEKVALKNVSDHKNP